MAWWMWLLLGVLAYVTWGVFLLRRRKVCPNCGRRDQVAHIFYGVPGDTTDGMQWMPTPAPGQPKHLLFCKNCITTWCEEGNG